MRLKKLALITVFLFPVLLFPLTALTQADHSDKKRQTNSKEKEKITRWEFGINFGTYFANRYTAGYYNGGDRNLNKISYVMSNTYWYQEIAKLLNSNDTVIVREVPANMHYSVALTGGLFLRYNFTRTWGVFIEADFAQLKTDGEFTVEVDPASFLTQPDLRLFGIHGREQRVNLDLGAHCRFPVYKNRMNLFLQAGLNVNYVRVVKSYINIYDKEYSLINVYGNQNYVPNANLQENQTNQGGFGYGLYAGGGIGFTFTQQIGLELGGYLNYINVNLQGFSQFKPSFGIYLRFMLSNLINREED